MDTAIAPRGVATHVPARGDAPFSIRGISISFVLLLLITAIAALFRFHALGNRGLWLDETLSVHIARSISWTLFRTDGMREIDMPLYFALLHFWMVLGDSEVVIRSLSVVCSVLTIPFVYVLGSRLFGRNVGLIAAALLASNAFHIRYAQEARAYALVALFATIATWLLVRNLQQPQSASWAWYGVILALAVYSHVLGGVLIVATHCAAIAFLLRPTIPWRGLSWAGVCFACFTLPIAVIFPMETMKAGGLDWIATPDWSIVLHFLVLASGNRGLLLLTLSALMVAALAITSFPKWLRNARSLEEWPFILLLLWSFLPIIITLVISQVRPAFVPRYLLPCLPGILLTVSAGITRIRPRSIAWTLGGAIVVLSLAGTPSSYDLRNVVDDWRTITSGILDRAQPADGVWLYPDYARIPYEYYTSHRTPVLEWPVPLTIGSDDPIGQIRPAGLKHAESRTDPPTHRIWVVFHHPSPLSMPERGRLRQNLLSWRVKGWNILDLQEFPGVTVILFAASSDEAIPARELPNLFQLQQATVSQ